MRQYVDLFDANQQYPIEGRAVNAQKLLVIEGGLPKWVSYYSATTILHDGLDVIDAVEG